MDNKRTEVIKLNKESQAVKQDQEESTEKLDINININDNDLEKKRRLRNAVNTMLNLGFLSICILTIANTISINKILEIGSIDVSFINNNIENINLYLSLGICPILGLISFVLTFINYRLTRVIDMFWCLVLIFSAPILFHIFKALNGNFCLPQQFVNLIS